MYKKSMMLVALVLVLLTATFVIGIEDNKMTPTNKKEWPTAASKPDDAHVPAGKHITLELESGTVQIELYPDVAPNTVASFKALVSIGFYDGLTFHRVIPNFMAQGGDPDGTGMGGPGYNIDAEFNDKKHIRGTLSMARSASPNSAGSQFFICFGPQPHLDGQYTIFGQVTAGMDFVDQLKNGDVMKKLTVVNN